MSQALIKALAAALFDGVAIRKVAEKVRGGQDAILALPMSARPFFVAAAFARAPRATLVVVSGEEAAYLFSRDLAAWLGNDAVLQMPLRSDMPWRDQARDAHVIQNIGHRARAINALALGEPRIVVASARALLRCVPPPPAAPKNAPTTQNLPAPRSAPTAQNSAAPASAPAPATPTTTPAPTTPTPADPAGIFAPLTITASSELPRGFSYERLASALVGMGYERLDKLDGAETPGCFSMRGDTIDIYPAGLTHPVRVELFGDYVEVVRRQVPSTGQSIGTLPSVEIFPARELELNDATIRRALRNLDLYGAAGATAAGATPATNNASVTHTTPAARATRVANNASTQAQAPTIVDLSSDPAPATTSAAANLHTHYEQIKQGIFFNELERYLPYLYAEPVSPLSYLHPQAMVVLIEPRSLFDDSARYFEEVSASARVAKASTKGLYIAPEQLDFGTQQRLTLLSLISGGSNLDARLEVKHADVSTDERLASTVRGLLASKYLTVVADPSQAARTEAALTLSDAHLPFKNYEPQAGLEQRVANVADADVPASLIIPEAKIALVSIGGGSAMKAATQRTRKGKVVDPTSLTFPFKPGDYVVHATHGIALFKEIVRQELAGVERDYLYLEYAHGDKLFTPVEQIDRITRYVGPESASPRLTRLNTSDWTRATGKARKAARKLAFDLVDLYARRGAVTGYAYAADNEQQYLMELAFPYEETPDQLSAIADVKADMSSSKPMDRLICGDVGFGKTEVALRAAFKAVQSGKQVMLLCPTTILAQQHYLTFFERFDPFAVNVEVMSRFRTAAEQQRTLKGLAEGSVDVVVGTHRLLSADVNPRDLGLIIIDEEQRFGVQHKEQLKNLREHVDVLTLSATPIPRTMQMAISGVRDMSMIDTPPPSRTPIRVHVGEWDEDVVSAAIRAEMQRGGQVYYVSNRVKTIDEAVARVTSVAPEARVGIAHGKMTPAQLETIMESFAANEYDVLVATTIIESGLDNPHTNTLIIEDSQRLGLAQLYQLKGRVGRSHAQAYAYFLFPSQAALTEEAVERLTAIDEFQELGAGLKIAMRDLEIRGAGSLLGAEQHGMLSAVGFDLFASMLKEAVAAARAGSGGGGGAGTGTGGASDEVAHAEVKIDLPVPFFFPEEYIAAADERVLYYRRLAAAADADSIAGLQEQLEQSYGAMPFPAQNLVDRSLAKALAAAAGVQSVSLQRNKLVLEPVSLGSDAAATLKAQGATYMVKSKRLMYPVQEGVGMLNTLINLLNSLANNENRPGDLL